MLLLFETSAGFALFKLLLDEEKLEEDLCNYFSTAESAREVVKLKDFSRFENTAEALVDGKISEGLCKFLTAHCDGERLAVAESKLGNAIKEELKIECVQDNAVMELMRLIRSQLTELLMSEKVDTMILQAIGLLDDLDKGLNTYAMRVREWYGWHFPELAEIVRDNILYAKAVKLMGSRDNAAKLDFSEILPEAETEVKEAAMISMGTEVSDVDLMNIRELCDQVLSLADYRAQLFDYLKSRMNIIAPNLTALVGELVGARLIAHDGSLLNLAKQPGCKFRYGIISRSSLDGQAPRKLKRKISRSLAAKIALAIRYDAFGDGQDNSMGLENRAKLEARLRNLEGIELGRSAVSAKDKPKIEVYDKDKKKTAGGLITPPTVDTMIIPAIGLLDDLDKGLNTYAVRVREWYGWHFPELAEIVQDNILYAKAVKLMGSRDNAAKLDFSEILPEVETELKEAAMISMGTEVSDVDLMNIRELCDRVLSLDDYRAQLYDYLKSRMNTIAPNLTALVGEIVGARLIAHGGGLLNIAKQPGSTFKDWLISHDASLVGQAPRKMKRKISRSLTAKIALAIQYDAVGLEKKERKKKRKKAEEEETATEPNDKQCQARKKKGKKEKKNKRKKAEEEETTTEPNDEQCEARKKKKGKKAEEEETPIEPNAEQCQARKKKENK